MLPDCTATFARTAQRYQSCGRGAYAYVRAKLRHDPVHRDVLALAAGADFGDVLDIGCGRGQLGIALLEAGLARAVLGVDCHAGHLAQAARAGVGLAYRAEPQNLASDEAIPAADTVLLVDVLYQLDSDAQHLLLRAVSRAARQRIVMRLLDPDRGMRSVLTIGLEKILRQVSPHAGSYVNPWSVARVVLMLEAAGFAAAVTPCWRGTPFSNVLLIAQRRF